MFQIIAILAFFTLGIAFFAIGKDDFGIIKIKEDSNNISSKDKKIEFPEEELSNKSTQDIQEVSNENKSDSEASQ